MQASAVSASSVRPGWHRAASLGVWALAAYLTIVLPVDRVFPALDRWWVAAALLVASLALIHLLLGKALLRGPSAAERAKNVTLLTATTLASLLALDVAFTVHGNLDPDFRADQTRVLGTRLGDARMWVSELMPELYFLEERRLWLYKPGQSVRATVHGEHYYPALLQHPLLRDSVLELRELDVVIDEYGLRNLGAPAGARIFALGDSFCFGFGAPQAALFSERMQAALGEPVYNLGISATSPVHQVELLELLLTSHPEAFRPRHLLWLVFEANDLDESVRNASPLPPAAPGLGQILADTLVADVAQIPSLLRRRSAIRLLTSGPIAFKRRGSSDTATDHRELDGRTLVDPLYHSPRFGHRLFRQAYLDVAMQPGSWVSGHPNLPRFEAAFRKMQTLATEHAFRVTVVSVPSAERLYRDAFEDMPAIGDEPHFIRHVEGLAGSLGFAHLDLSELLRPYAERELLYYRDDSHWNERGHQVVAELLAAHLAPLAPRLEAGAAVD